MLTTMLASEEQTEVFGHALAEACNEVRSMSVEPIILFLHGQLGAGKTTLSRGFLRGLQYSGAVKSPTYTLVEPYETAIGSVYHFDLYRIQHPEELEFMGIQDYFNPGAICLIEWPDNGNGALPLPDVSCYIQFQDGGRKIETTAHSARGQAMLLLLEKKVSDGVRR